MDLDRVRAVIEPVVEAAGLELYDIELVRGTLRVSIDREGGIDLDAVAGASQAISDALDEDDPGPAGPAAGREAVTPGDDPYTLEVSSPGLERPLRTPAHFRRYVGTTVAVRTQPGVDGDRRIQATLDAADENGITIGGRDLSYDQIERARTVFEWGPAPKPGAPAPNRPKKRTSTR